MYLFVDPGETTGWAKFNDQGVVMSVGQVKKFDSFSNWLISEINLVYAPNIKQVIVERFALYPWKSQAQMWSEFETVQVIGAIRFQCHQFDIKYDTVPAANYPMGFRYQGLPVPPHSNPLHDQLVAHAHGIYWLQTHGIRQPQAR